MKCKLVYDSFVIDYNKQVIHFIENNEISKAKLVLQKINQIISNESIRNLQFIKSLTYHSYGLYYKSIGKTDQALNFFQKSLEISKNGKNVSTLSSSHLNISQIFLSNNQPSKALSHALLALKCSRFENTDLLLIYLSIGNAYKQKGDYLLAMKYFGLGSEISKKVYGANYKLSVVLAREYEKIARKTNFSTISLHTPKKKLSVQDIVFKPVPKSLSPLRAATPSPSNRRKSKLSIFKNN